MRSLRVAFIGSVGFLLLACSADDEPDVITGTVTGTVDGAAFTAKGVTAVAFPVDTCTNGPVLLFNIGFDADFDVATLEQNMCSLKASSRWIGVDIWKNVSSGQIGPGTYPTRDNASGGQVAYQVRLDDTCTQKFPNVISTSGEVILESVDATHVVGSLDVKFPAGGSLRGRFDAPMEPAVSGACHALGLGGGSDLSPCPETVCVP